MHLSNIKFRITSGGHLLYHLSRTTFPSLRLCMSLGQGLPVARGCALASAHIIGCLTPILGQHSPAAALDEFHTQSITGQNQGAGQARLLSRGPREEKSFLKLTQVTGKIQFLAAIDLITLIPSWPPVRTHFLLLEAAKYLLTGAPLSSSQ